MLKTIYTPIAAKAHQNTVLFTVTTDIIQRVAILVHKGFKKGTNTTEFCFYVTNHFEGDSFSNGLFQISYPRIKLIFFSLQHCQ